MYRFVLLSVGFDFNLIRCICMKLLGPMVSQAVVVCVTLCWCWVSGRRLLWACMCLCDCLCSCPQTFIYTPFSPFNFTWRPFLFWKSSGKSCVFFFFLSFCVDVSFFDQHWYPNLFTVSNSKGSQRISIVLKRKRPRLFASIRVIYCFFLSTVFHMNSTYTKK